VEYPRGFRGAALTLCGMQSLLLLCAFIFCASHAVADFALVIPASARQLVLVTAPAWSSTRGELRRFERSGGPWREVGERREVLLGEHGLAWGLGLHSIPRDSAPRKREGDRCAPAGIFTLPSAFGRAPIGNFALPYRQLRSDTEAVDDPTSRFYNRIVNRAETRQPDWKSSERMAEIPDYELGLVVAHNPRNLPGAGSCIFLHLWVGERRGTAGCTVLGRPHLLELLHWLDARQYPVLVQLPLPALPADFPPELLDHR
jgi:D-alanyl-D-alanine dipeptidase